jgi:glutaconyl-CoA/methylmalonyl-CoA decarboxylase subunit gamma
MPIFHVTVDGREYTVEIPDPNERPVRAIVDGYVLEVGVEAGVLQGSGAAQTLRNSAAWDASAGARDSMGNEAPVAREASSLQVAGAAAGSVSNGEVTVAAPLPGTIVSIGVAEGDRVEHGQELCVLEAMKMNNPIRATQAGVVKEVLVSVGQQVQHNHPLLVMTEA